MAEQRQEDRSIDLVSIQAEQQSQMDLQSVSSYFSLAQKAFNEKRYRIAIIYLKKILQIDTSFVSAFKMLARIFQIRKNYKKAADILRQALETNFRDADLHYQLGYTYYLQGDGAGYARECTKSLVVNPNYSKAFYALALLNYEKHKYDKALIEVGKCLKLNDNDLDAHVLAAKILVHQRLFPEAEQHLLAALKLNRTNVLVIQYLGEVLYIQKKYEQAITYFLETGSTEPKIRARIEHIAGQLKTDLFNRLDAQPNDVPTLLELAELYYRLQDHAAAKQVLTTILQQEPQNLKARINYGLMLVHENKFLEGIRVYHEVQKVSPANKEVANNLDAAYALAEKYALSHFQYETSKKELMEIYMLQEQYDKAALVMAELNNTEQAREILQRITHKHFSQQQIYQGAVLWLLGELDQAQYIFEHLEKQEDKNYRVYYFLGLLAKAKGRMTEAYKYFDRSRVLKSDYWFVERELQDIRIAEIARLEGQLATATVPTLVEFIDLLILTGQYQRALVMVTEFRREYADAPDLKERQEKVISIYEQELERDLEDTPAVETFLDLGEIYMHKQRFNEAFLLLQTALTQYPEDKEILNFFTYVVNRNIEVYEELVLKDDKTMIYYNLAVLYAIANRKADSLAMLEHAVTCDKKLAIQAKYEEAFRKYRELDRFRLITLIEGEDKNIYRMQD